MITSGPFQYHFLLFYSFSSSQQCIFLIIPSFPQFSLPSFTFPSRNTQGELFWTLAPSALCCCTFCEDLVLKNSQEQGFNFTARILLILLHIYWEQKEDYANALLLRPEQSGSKHVDVNGRQNGMEKKRSSPFQKWNDFVRVPLHYVHGWFVTKQKSASLARHPCQRLEHFKTLSSSSTFWSLKRFLRRCLASL